MLIFSSYLQAEEKIVLASTDDVLTNASREILLYAYNQINVQVETILLPAERALVWSNQGRYDGEVSRISNVDDKYPNLIMIPVAINKFEAVVFSKKADVVVDGWESLRSYSILLRIGSKYAERGTEGMNVRKLPSNAAVFHTLSKSWYDIAVNPRISGIVQIEKQGLTNIKIIEPPLATYMLYHYLHKKNKHLISKITHQLKKMEENGMIEKIRNEYLKSVITNLRVSRVQ
jgi:polar amino acid transport system substrate-binding protein